HGGGDGRDRQYPRRAARRPDHRVYPAAVRLTSGAAVDSRGGVRLPHLGDGASAPRPARRGDQRGRMTELLDLLRELRRALARRLPPWWTRALALILIAIAIVLPFFFAPASGFLNATIISIAYVVMALGLNL